MSLSVIVHVCIFPTQDMEMAEANDTLTVLGTLMTINCTLQKIQKQSVSLLLLCHLLSQHLFKIHILSIPYCRITSRKTLQYCRQSHTTSLWVRYELGPISSLLHDFSLNTNYMQAWVRGALGELDVLLNRTGDVIARVSWGSGGISVSNWNVPFAKLPW